jgi:hypothetical protein
MGRSYLLGGAVREKSIAHPGPPGWGSGWSGCRAPAGSQPQATILQEFAKTETIPPASAFLHLGGNMALDVLNEQGTFLEDQTVAWRDLVQAPYSRLDDDAFTRVRVLFMNAVEAHALHMNQAASLSQGGLRMSLAAVSRAEHLQQVAVNDLNPADQSILETTIGYQQAAVELGAAMAQAEPDPFLGKTIRLGMLEDLDHLYRFSALLDRLEGQDANTVLQCYTDIRPGRRGLLADTSEAPVASAPVVNPMSKVHVNLLLALCCQMRNYCLNAAPTCSDATARLLYAEVATSLEERARALVSFLDPSATWLERWMLMEASEAYAYWSCLKSEENPRIRELWDRFLGFELGHCRLVADHLRTQEGRNADAFLPGSFAEPLPFRSQRDFIRQCLEKEIGVPSAPEAISFPPSPESARTTGEPICPSELVALHYQWEPGGELFGQIPENRETLLKEYCQ